MAREQFEDFHSTTIEVPDGVTIEPFRFVGMDGNYADGSTNLKNSQGISKSGSYQDAVPVITYYSGIIECETAVAEGDYLKPGTDGKAVVGSATDHCAVARAAADAGGLTEAIIYRHIHP